MELILAMRKPMLRSKLTLKAIKRPKRPFNEFASSSNNELASSSNNEFASSSNNESASYSNSEQNPLDESMRTFGPSNMILPMKACQLHLYVSKPIIYFHHSHSKFTSTPKFRLFNYCHHYQIWES